MCVYIHTLHIHIMLCQGPQKEGPPRTRSPRSGPSTPRSRVGRPPLALMGPKSAHCIRLYAQTHRVCESVVIAQRHEALIVG